MFSFKKLGGAFILFFLIAIFTSCGQKKEATSDMSTSTETASLGKEYTSAYVCPMHCKGSGSEAEGKCPVCEMDYVKNNTHACPMHPEVKGIDGDKCSKCNMDLKAVEDSDDHSGHDHG